MSSLWVRADSRVSARLSASAAVFVVLAARIHSCSMDLMDAWSLMLLLLMMFCSCFVFVFIVVVVVVVVVVGHDDFRTTTTT